MERYQKNSTYRKLKCFVLLLTLIYYFLQNLRYGKAHEPIWSVVGVVMEHRNLARQRYQKWILPLVARIPLALVCWPL